MQIAFDPGEHWTGIAMFERIDARTTMLMGGTLRHEENLYRPVEALVQALNKWSKIEVVALEDFRAWGKKHQLFSTLGTVRLIGALEHTAKAHKIPVHKVPASVTNVPGINQLTLMRIFLACIGDYHHPLSPWDHGVSAMRVLLHYWISKGQEWHKLKPEIDHQKQASYFFDIDRDMFFPPTFLRWS